MAICRKILRQVDNFHFFSDLNLSVDHLAKNDENLSKKSLLPFSTYIISMTTNRDSWIFSIPAVPAEIIVPWILSQGGDAVPLSPQSIVEAVQEKSDRLSKMFA